MELTTAYKGELSFRERLARPAFLKLFGNVDERSVFPLRWGDFLTRATILLSWDCRIRGPGLHISRTTGCDSVSPVTHP